MKLIISKIKLCLRAVSVVLAAAILILSSACSKSTGPSNDKGGEFDYDLTKMNSNMIIATVNDMINGNPENYLGKTIRLSGTYYAQYYEPTQNYYHYVVIEDALACCQQGVEFMCRQNDFEYPESGVTIDISGVFSSYIDIDGLTYYYVDVSSLSVVA